MSSLTCLCIGTPKTINFPFVPNGKLIVFGVPYRSEDGTLQLSDGTISEEQYSPYRCMFTVTYNSVAAHGPHVRPYLSSNLHPPGIPGLWLLCTEETCINLTIT